MFRRGYRPFKLTKGENGTTTFLPLNTKIGGPVKYAQDKKVMCLTKEQTTHIYKKIEPKSVLNMDTIKQELEEDKLSGDNIGDKVNPYHNVILNNKYKDNNNTSQMEQLPILSNVVNYVQYNRNPKNFGELNVKVLDQKYHKKMNETLKDDERQTVEIDFGNNPDKLRREYSGMYEGVQLEVLNTTRFDESSDWSTA